MSLPYRIAEPPLIDPASEKIFRNHVSYEELRAVREIIKRLGLSREELSC